MASDCLLHQAKSVLVEQLLDGCEQAMRLQVEQIPPNELPSRLAELEKLGRPMQPALVLARERAAHLAESLSLDIERATNEAALLQLLTERPVSGFQLCTGLSKLARQVQLCPDPESWAASIVSRPEFAKILAKLHDFLPALDSGYLREALCALAELSVRRVPRMACPCMHALTRPCMHALTTAPRPLRCSTRVSSRPSSRRSRRDCTRSPPRTRRTACGRSVPSASPR